MNLFINDKPIYIKEYQDLKTDSFDTILDGKEVLTSKKLVGNVVIQNATIESVERLLKLLEIKKLKKLTKITFLVSNVDLVKQVIKDNFKIVKAGGGIVEKDGKILMIYRLKKWDLPKGKLKKKEKNREGAKREVEEECNIKVEVNEKLCTTWHSYKRKGKKYLKKINWYKMTCLDDKNMQPQIEEDIRDVRWMDKSEAAKYLKKSYKSIIAVYEFYEDSLQS